MSKKNKKTNGGNVVSEGRNGGFIELDPSEIR